MSYDNWKDAWMLVHTDGQPRPILTWHKISHKKSFQKDVVSLRHQWSHFSNGPTHR